MSATRTGSPFSRAAITKVGREMARLNPFSFIGAARFLDWENVAIFVQELEKLPWKVQPVYVFRVGFGDHIGNDGARGLKQLAIELVVDRMGQQAPKRQV